MSSSSCAPRGRVHFASTPPQEIPLPADWYYVVGKRTRRKERNKFATAAEEEKKEDGSSSHHYSRWLTRQEIAEIRASAGHVVEGIRSGSDDLIWAMAKKSYLKTLNQVVECTKSDTAISSDDTVASSSPKRRIKRSKSLLATLPPHDSADSGVVAAMQQQQQEDDELDDTHGNNTTPASSPTRRKKRKSKKKKKNTVTTLLSPAVREELAFWMQVGHSRRGLERYIVEDLRCGCHERRRMIQKIVFMGQQQEKSHQVAETIRLASEKVSQPARAFAEIVAAADAAAVSSNNNKGEEVV